MVYSNKTIELNPKILEILSNTEDIEKDKALVFLFIYEYSPDRVGAFIDPLKVSKTLAKLGLLDRDYDGDKIFRLRYPLFIKKVDDLDWLEDYRKMFSSKEIGVSGKMGDPNSCKKKMITFMSENEYDKDDILAATKLYISKTDIRFLRRADYFISKEKQGSGPISDLLIWCEELESNGGSVDNPFEIQA